MDVKNCVNCNESFQFRKCHSSEDLSTDLRNVVSTAFGYNLTIQKMNFSSFQLCTTCSEPSKIYCTARKLFLKLCNPGSKISRLLKEDSNISGKSQEPSINESKYSEIANMKKETQNEDTILPDQENYSGYEINNCTNELVKQEYITDYQEQYLKLEVWKLSEENIAQFTKQRYSYQKSKTVEESSNFHSCSTCSRIFSEPDLLVNHKNSAHVGIQQNLSCSFCSKTFMFVWFLINHLKVFHNGIEILHYCQICRKKFYSEKDLEEHVLKAHDVRKHPYKCRNCYESFELIQELREHLLNYHEGTKEANAAEGNIKAKEEQKLKTKQCNICEEIFETPLQLGRHRTLDHGVKDKCEVCNKEFPSLKSLIDHRQIHKICPTCDKPFPSYHRMSVHYETVHAPIVDLPFGCEMCGQKYSMEKKLLSHYYWHVQVCGPKQFCNICNNAFKTKSHLMLHMRLKHSDVCSQKNKHKCPFCDQLFTTKGNLGSHLGQKHQDSLEFPCKICGKKFLNFDSVRAHKRVHTQETGFENQKHKSAVRKLGKTGVTNGQLEVMACYSSETFHFTCPICGKSCDSQTHFFRHLKLVHELKGYADPNAKVSSSIKCPFCDKVFGRKDLLDKHKRRAHNITIKNPVVPIIPRMYDCPHCKKIIEDCTFTSFKAHVNRHEISIIQKTKDNQTVERELAEFYCDKDNVFKCNICKFTCKKRPEFLRHTKEAKSHPLAKIIYENAKKDTVKFPFTCEQCPDLSYPTIQLLKRHKEAHRFRKDRIQKCSICEQVLKTRKHLKMHMQMNH